MSSSQLEDSIKSLFHSHLELKERQISNIASVSSALMLAGSTYQSHVARWLRRPGNQAYRLQFFKRLLTAPYLSQEKFYYPLVSQALKGYTEPVWHLVMDRSTLIPHQREMLMLSLAFRKRAVPLGWEVIKFGATGAEAQNALVQRVCQLIPEWQSVVFHGDTEFGAVPLMKGLRQKNWHFILGQTRKSCYRTADGPWIYLGDIEISERNPVYLEQIYWTKKHSYGPVNLFAFYAPHKCCATASEVEFRYQVTSLPMSHMLRVVGRRRWGTEPLFRDFKSSGWHIDQAAMGDPLATEQLLTLLSFNYLWATCIGRWLCKTGQRRLVDIKKRRSYSLFRIGWDWLIYQHVMEQTPPNTFTLYA